MSVDSTSLTFWSSWLRVVSAGVAVFGLVLVIMPELSQQAFGLLVYADRAGIERFGSEAIAYIGLVHAVLGSVMIGWGVLLFVMSGRPFQAGQREAWFAIAVSLGLWFIPDTTFSILSGFWQNAFLNTIFAVLYSIPLVATYGRFHDANS